MKTKDLVCGYGKRNSDIFALNDVGAGIRNCRKSNALSQNQLGERLGVRKSQVCKIEKGNNLTLDTVSGAFSSMGMKASVVIEPDMDDTTLYFLVSDLFDRIEEWGQKRGLDFRSAYIEMKEVGMVDEFIMGWYEKI